MSFLKRRILSFKYAAQGFRWAFATQINLWIHLVAAICAVGLGFYFNISKIEWVTIIICITLVFAAEFINTAIEWLVDSIYKEKNTLAGKIKDLGAAAVLVTAIGVAVVGVIIFYPYCKAEFF